MDIGTAIAIVGSALASAGTVIGVSKVVWGRDKTWVEPMNRLEGRVNTDIEGLRERIHGVEVGLETIKHLTAALQEIKDMIIRLEAEEREDVLRLENKIENLSNLILKSLQK